MESDFWAGKRVLLTGGNGFLGKNLVPRLKGLGPEISAPRRGDFDLRRESEARKMFKRLEPEIVIHMAVHGGGIGYMVKHPAEIFLDNTLMNTNALHCAMDAGVEKFVGIGTVCEYPKLTPVPFKEANLWNGYPEETNAAYGLTKRMLLVQTQAYRKSYGFNGIHLLLANLYGPHDNFDPKQSHVIPALIVKMADAKARGEDKVIVWGTGRASREFLFAPDAADGIIMAAESYDKQEPVNVGTGTEITIKDLADKIAKATGFGGRIEWDSSKPDGQPRRRLDVSRAKREFGFAAKTSLDEGIRQTVEWYAMHRGGRDAG